MTAETLEQTLLTLPAADRARLAEMLIRSLDDDIDQGVDEADVAREWQALARQRADDLRSGAIEALAGEDVAAEVRRLLR